MNGTIEVPTPLRRPPGLENLTGAELARLAANPKFREVVRAEFSKRPELLEVMCRGGCGKRLRLSDSEPPEPNCRYICKGCSRDRSVLDAPSEIKKVLEGKSLGKKRRVYEALASTRASRDLYIVDYPNGQFGYSEGGYKPYRREKVRQTGREWRKKNSPGRGAEYKRRYRKGDRRAQFRDVPVDSGAADAAWRTTLEQFGFACSTLGCGRGLDLKTAIRWQQDAAFVPICRRCLGKKAAVKRWSNAKTEKKHK
ncbi:MAG TPA: hypothetical protein VMI32_13025 [Candidatus Solibacter sp.]|nr:hypothetical protein [Candidatus Solibacter sp.]